MTAVDPDLARRLAAQGDVPQALPVPVAPCPVTARELQVLALVAEGVPTGAIGRRLGITWDTVRSHLIHAARRTGLSGRCALVAWAFRAGYLRWVGDRVVADHDPRPRLFWFKDRPMPVEQAEQACAARLALEGAA